MNNPLISIIIPVYNFGYLGEYCFKICLEAIRKQTYTNFEVLLLENFSKDDTVEAIQKYLNEINDNRFKLFILDKPGLTNARNRGIEKSTGDYIAFIDGDDTISSDYLQSGIDCINEHNVDIVAYNYVLNYIYKNKIKPITNHKNNVFFRNNIDNKAMGSVVWAKLYRASLIKDNKIYFDETLIGGEDTLYGATAYFAANKMATVEKGLYYYTQNRKNQTTFSQKYNVARSTLKAHISIGELYHNLNVYNDNKDAYGNRFIDITIGVPLGNTLLKNLNLKDTNKILNEFKDIFLSFNVEEYDIVPWKKKWFKKFQKACKKNNLYFFMQYIRLYRNLFIKPFKIKWYK